MVGAEKDYRVLRWSAGTRRGVVVDIGASAARRGCARSTRATAIAKMFLERAHGRDNGSECWRDVATMVLRLRAEGDGPGASKVDEAGRGWEGTHALA
jgi:hypothetical protein